MAAETAQVAVQWPDCTERQGFGMALAERGLQDLTQRLLSKGRAADRTLVVNTLFRDTVDHRQVAQALACRIASANFFVAIELFLGAIGTKRGRQGQALVEPR